ncbi:ribonuclease H [Schumannella sp. 10F1B-5-1]|uniref:ribonuclease H family protein n=1 Tax=Schumannella sp. 10F1B-5-1 TaxID=2590780 RepID=UPI0011310F36|nr:ribonuclease H [Schumannella sp. 10F1B-5-1]TPW70796.1 ribonuclease HI [Schumannella sp. 10F1B-5-1]
MTITAAADGSALGNPGPAGWAWFVDEQNWAAGGWPHATNNRGELQAVLELFRATAHVDDDLLVLCDSQYAINCITKWMPGWKSKGWRKRDGAPVLNVDLLQELDEAIRGRRYRFEWVKGHAGHDLNEAADVRARAVAESYRSGGAADAGPGFAGAPGGAASAGASASPEPVVGGTAATTADAHPLDLGDDPADRDLPAETALFDFDEPTEVEVVVRLDPDEHRRLVGRAQDEGVSPEELLRSLI